MLALLTSVVLLFVGWCLVGWIHHYDLNHDSLNRILVTCPICGCRVEALPRSSPPRRAHPGDLYPSPATLRLRVNGEGAPIPCRECGADLTLQWLNTAWFKSLRDDENRRAALQEKAREYNTEVAALLKL